MASRQRGGLPDQRRTTDRRAAARTGEGQARGRRESDAGEARSASTSAAADGAPRKRRSTRDGRVPLVIYLRPEAVKSLKLAALEDDTTASAVVAEAVEGWLRTRGRAARR